MHASVCAWTHTPHAHIHSRTHMPHITDVHTHESLMLQLRSVIRICQSMQWILQDGYIMYDSHFVLSKQHQHLHSGSTQPQAVSMAHDSQ